MTLALRPVAYPPNMDPSGTYAINGPQRDAMRTASPLDATMPRYAAVAKALILEIERGRFPVGEKLPTEQEICERFGISRFTAREAIRRLTEAGLVLKRAGVGTIVKARTARSRYSASVSDLSELFAFNRHARLEKLSEDTVSVSGKLAEILPDATGQRWYRFSGRRFVTDVLEPIVHTEILVHPAYDSIRDRIGEPGVMVYQLLEEASGGQIVEMRQEIECIATPKKIAQALGTRHGSPALRVLRYYVGPHDALLSVSINTYPHDRFKLTTRWRLHWDPEPK